MRGGESAGIASPFWRTPHCLWCFHEVWRFWGAWFIASRSQRRIILSQTPCSWGSKVVNAPLVFWVAGEYFRAWNFVPGYYFFLKAKVKVFIFLLLVIHVSFNLFCQTFTQTNRNVKLWNLLILYTHLLFFMLLVHAFLQHFQQSMYMYAVFSVIKVKYAV